MDHTKPRILVVDDSPSMGFAAKSALEADHEVMICEDGLAAIAAIAGFKPHLVLVDITMPKLDGYETVTLIRRNEAFSDIPLVMMSGKGGVFDLARGRLVGFDGHLLKPFTGPDLRNTVETYLKREGTRQ